MSQSCLLQTGLGVEFVPTPEGYTEITFREYEPGMSPGPKPRDIQIPTGRSWSGMMTEKELFDLLLKAGAITLDSYEVGTGQRNTIVLKQRNL
jgi:hypothetical protein